jgi:3',5'-cyclic AMP phosphodiesterase CpdA
VKIAHISDLHFGCISGTALKALLRSLEEAAPDLVIASGDITQSATVAEFTEAQAFFARLPAPVLSVPGNHDLPGMDLVRFVSPFGRYKRFIAEELNPSFTSPLVHIEAINSARMILPHWNWANGSISRRQCARLAAGFSASGSVWKMCVLHHPAVNSRDFPLEVALFNKACLLRVIKQQRVDLVLAGHQHHAFVEPEASGGHTTLFVNASTTTSVRTRRQPNGFNLLEFSESHVRIDMLRLNGDRFETFSATTHTRA